MCKLYKVPVMYRCEPCYAPVTIKKTICGEWTVGFAYIYGLYSLPVNNGKEIWTAKKEEAEAVLEKAAKEYGWEPWPDDWPAKYLKPIKNVEIQVLFKI